MKRKRIGSGDREVASWLFGGWTPLLTGVEAEERDEGR